VRLTPSRLRVPKDDLAAAFGELSRAARSDLRLAAQRIRAFHLRQREKSWMFRDGTGARLGQRITPLERVGVYVPGGAPPIRRRC
jgi:histidinol dehydrogenase